MYKEFTSIECRRKGNGVLLTATGPDGLEKNITMPSEEIRAIFECSVDIFLDRCGDDEAQLWQLFNSIAGIEYMQRGA